MADETIITPTPSQEIQPSRAEERITDLSNKVQTIAGERDTERTLREAAEKRAAFAEGYADIVVAHPAAKEHKEEIAAKVSAGLSVEDATFAVLGKAGKLGAVAPAPVSPAGGSAATTITGSTEKPIGEMTLAEKREQLAKDIVWS